MNGPYDPTRTDSSLGFTLEQRPNHRSIDGKKMKSSSILLVVAIVFAASAAGEALLRLA